MEDSDGNGVDRFQETKIIQEMSNFNPASYFELDTKAILFNKLKEENPGWWEKVKEEKRVYINIRKDGSINVYCRGESVMKLEYKKGDYVATISSAYLSDDVVKGKAQQLSPQVISDRLDEIVERIIRRKPTDEPEGDSEEGIKGAMFLSGGFIDTEFAYMRKARETEIQNRIKKNKNGHRISQFAQDRIDLIKVQNGAIQFVELKTISDPRLNDHNSPVYGKSSAEIAEQLSDYQHIIDVFGDKVLTYYQNIQKVMKSLGINNDTVNQTITRVSDYVELYFVGYNDGKSFDKKRLARIKTMKQLLEDNHITHSNIDDILNDYLKLRSK